MNVAFIPVRGGSKSIPLKNIRPIGGRPLVYWTVRAACGCGAIDRVYIATDSDRIRETVEAAEDKGYTPLVLAAGAAPDIAGLEDKVYRADYKTLLTLNRSNGGAVWIDDGSIIRKWPACNLPDGKELGRLAQRDPLEMTVKYLTRGRIRAQGYCLYLIALLIFI